jgi:putative ABC transport system permease protein
LASAIDAVAASLVGFNNVVRVPQTVLAGGFLIGLGMSILGAVAAGWRLQRLEILEQLE